MDIDKIIERLLIAFPSKIVEGRVAPHDCPECLSLREYLTSKTWREVLGEFLRANPDVLPLLSHEAYIRFLPAWLYHAILDLDGEVSECLLINLGCTPDTTGFTPEQAETIVAVARFIVANKDYYSPGDAESLAEIERAWQSHSGALE